MQHTCVTYFSSPKHLPNSIAKIVFRLEKFRSYRDASSSDSFWKGKKSWRIRPGEHGIGAMHRSTFLRGNHCTGNGLWADALSARIKRLCDSRTKNMRSTLFFGDGSWDFLWSRFVFELIIERVRFVVRPRLLTRDNVLKQVSLL